MSSGLQNSPLKQGCFQLSEKLQLLLWQKQEDLLDDLPWGWQVDEAVDVHVHKCGHQELTVEPENNNYVYSYYLGISQPVHNTTMSRYDVSKILDLEGPLEAGSEEASKGADDGGEEGHPESVEEEGIDGQGLLVDQKARPGAQSLEGQPPLLEGRDKEKISIVRCRPAPGRGEKVHMSWSSAPARWSTQLGRQSMEP